MDSSFSMLENFGIKNQNQNRENINNHNNNNQASRPNFDLNIPPSVNTFNMIFINTKINDVNLGYRSRTYNKKKNNKNSFN